MNEFSDRQRLSELAKKWLDGTITDIEAREFADWYNQFPDEEIELDPGFAVNKEELKTRMYATIDQRAGASRVKRIVVFRRVAAAVLILLITGIVYYLIPSSKKENTAAVINNQKDINAPQQTKAILTLADGRKIELENAADGELASNIIKKEGSLLYSVAGNKNIQSNAFNTVSLPRGSLPVNIRLSDGSRVWINSASSITYPVVFNGAAREVNITGEVYFEIAKNKIKPFRVKSDGQEIEVLGTQFNVNAYADESSVKTTLLEGKIKVTANKEGIVLTPGEQAINNNKKLITERLADASAAAAWKDNRFVFGGQADIETIMRALSRWYNIEVQYQGKPGFHFGGSIPRNISLSQVLKVLENTGGVHFKTNGNIVTVMP